MSEPSKLQVWFRLFWIFLKVNLLTTAGPTSIGLLYKECVGKIMTEAQFVEAVGFSNLVPGSEALKLAMFIGYSSGGLLGVLAALLGAKTSVETARFSKPVTSGRVSLSRRSRIGGRCPLSLFDKVDREERETQAAESWRAR